MKTVDDIASVKTEGVTSETYLPDPSKLISGQPTQTLWNNFSSPDNKFHVGIWDSQAGEWAVNYSEQEFCLILEGESVIHDEQGGQRSVKAGDQFYIPAGFKGRWEVPEYCKKIYVIYEA
ncbi:transcriptional regulator [Hahella sp. CCB-MM4]|uniref:cupin domain-containing protein n=1 Tax=Hahella sp. (strain CCB-MM4) TaxID=1926491 RepID=UPI000B9BF37E|nr:cupin domain-containing protein [Hahella sp. CCB-MM4]OZG74435.1 transcriptional regulator [Hahella sp. CCB-MM4]